MSRAIILRPRAVADIDHYFDFIAEDNFDAAVRFYHAVFETVDLIAERPDVGRRRDLRVSESMEIRSRPVRGFPNHLVFYTVPEEDPMRVLRILHGAMDLDSVFGEESDADREG